MPRRRAAPPSPIKNSALARRCRHGRLTRIDTAQGSTHFEIDARGRRVRKSGPLGERQYHYDHAGRLLAESTPNGIHDREYIYLGELPVAAVAEGTLYHLDPDHLGTPRLATDGQGVAVWRWEGGEPFGAQAPDEDPGRTGVRFVLDLRFPGQYYDQETQLHYNYFRDYDPATGRYVQSDPIGLVGGSLSLYTYADQNPLSNIDPLGLFNPAKGASALGNAAIAGFSAASGGLKIAIAAGLSPASPTGVGALPPAALLAWGTWNLKSSAAAWIRSQQQWREAQCEDSSQAVWKNLYGMLPGGTNYDDPGEASGPLNYIQNQGWWKFIGHMGYF